jgi:hypothetical protein
MGGPPAGNLSTIPGSRQTPSRRGPCQCGQSSAKARSTPAALEIRKHISKAWTLRMGSGGTLPEVMRWKLNRQEKDEPASTISQREFKVRRGMQRPRRPDLDPVRPARRLRVLTYGAIDGLKVRADEGYSGYGSALRMAGARGGQHPRSLWHPDDSGHVFSTGPCGRRVPLAVTCWVTLVAANSEAIGGATGAELAGFMPETFNAGITYALRAWDDPPRRESA